MRTLLWFAVFALVGCEEGGPTMKPGEDCKGCHHDFTVAGTVYPTAQAQANEGLAGVTVTVVDSAQASLVLTSNEVGNFYSKAAVAWPATITLALGTRTATMPGASSGACASCHSSAAQGRVYLP
jgi:hypothetical protein